MTTLMQAASRRPSWKEVLDQHAPLLLPVAHDALTARPIKSAGSRLLAHALPILTSI